MNPLALISLYQPVRKQLEVFAVDDDGSLMDVWKEEHNASWRRHPLTGAKLAPAGSPLGGAFFEPDERLNVFLVALTAGTTDPGQGVIHWLSKFGNFAWTPQTPIAAGPGPRFRVGAGIAAAWYPPHGTLEVVAAGNDGAVWVLWMNSTGPWRIAPIADRGFAASGTPLASAYYRNHDTLEVLMVDAHGAVNVLWKSSTVAWRKVAITNAGLAKSEGTHVAMTYYDGYGQLEGFLVDAQGRVLVLWKTASAPWQWVPLTDPSFAPPGAPIAAVHNATHDQLEVFVVGNDGALWLLWKRDNAPWNPAARLSESRVFQPGAPVSTAHFPPTDQLEVFVGDRVHLAREMTKYENQAWRPCALPIAPRSGVAPPLPDVQTSRLMQLSGTAAFRDRGVEGIDLGANTTHQGNHFVFFGDVPRGNRNSGPGQDADAVAYARFMDQGTLQLELITGPDGLFAPFRGRFKPGAPSGFPGANPVMELGNAQTPTGAFSWGGQVYVFVLVAETFGQPWSSPTSYLMRNTDPFNGQPYEQVFRFSEGKFWQCSPWVVPDLPELPRHAGRGVVVLGQGSNDKQSDATYLAWMPLNEDGPVFGQIRYYTKDPADPWGNNEAQARPLWPTTLGYSSISLAHIDGAGVWIALYSHAIDKLFYRQRSPVVARIGTSLTHWSDEIVVFDPCRDGAYGNFMHWPDLDDLHLGGIPADDVPAWAYGAFIVPPLTRWHAAEKEVTLHYLMSTHRPYQVQLMRSRFKIP